MEGNNAPFAIGQKVIRTKDSATLKKGETYTVSECIKCNCGLWRIAVAEDKTNYSGHECSACKNERFGKAAFYAKFFTPIQHQYTDIAKEIADSYKSTEEVPDKIIIPERVNN